MLMLKNEHGAIYRTRSNWRPQTATKAADRQTTYKCPYPIIPLKFIDPDQNLGQSAPKSSGLLPVRHPAVQKIFIIH